MASCALRVHLHNTHVSYGTGKKKRPGYLVGNLVATNWPIEKALHAILATANTQFGREMALVMQTAHAQRWQYPDRVGKRLFSAIENVHRYYKNPWVCV